MRVCFVRFWFVGARRAPLCPERVDHVGSFAVFASVCGGVRVVWVVDGWAVGGGRRYNTPEMTVYAEAKHWSVSQGRVASIFNNALLFLMALLANSATARK